MSPESEAVPLIRQHVASGTVIHADESNAWERLHASYDTRRVNHSVEYVSDEGASVNQAENFFSRPRRAEYGVHHRISGQYLYQYANEMAWREDNRRIPNGMQWLDRWCRSPSSEVKRVARLLAKGRSMRQAGATSLSLIEKRRELARLIVTLQEQLDQRWADLAHLDGALRLLGKDLDPAMIRPKRRYRRAPYFGRNELSRLVLASLRAAAGEPIGIEEISRRVVTAKGFDPGDASLREAVREYIRPVITRLHKQGVIEGVSGSRQQVEAGRSLARPAPQRC